MGCASSTLLKEIEADVLPVKRHLRSSYAHKSTEQSGLGTDSPAGGPAAVQARGALHDVLLLYSSTGSAWVAGLQDVLEAEHNLSVLGPSEQQARASSGFTRLSSTPAGLGEICPVKEGGRNLSGVECVVLSPSQMTSAAAQTKLGVVVLVTAGSTWDDSLTSCLRHSALRSKPMVLLHIPESCPAPNTSDWPADIQNMLLTRKIPMLTYISTFATYGAGRAVVALQQQRAASQQPQGAGVGTGTRTATPVAAKNQSAAAGSTPRTPTVQSQKGLQQQVSLSMDSKQPSGEMGGSSGTLTGSSTDSRFGNDSAKSSSSSEASSRPAATATVSVTRGGAAGKAGQQAEPSQPGGASEQSPWESARDRLIQQGWSNHTHGTGDLPNNSKLAAVQSVQHGGSQCKKRWDVVLAIHHPKFYPIVIQVAQALAPYFSVMVVDGSLATAGLNGVLVPSKPMRHTLHSIESGNQIAPRHLLPAAPFTMRQPTLSEQAGHASPFAMDVGLQTALLAAMPAPPLVSPPTKLPSMPASPPESSNLEASSADLNDVQLTLAAGTEQPVAMAIQQLAMPQSTSQQVAPRAAAIEGVQQLPAVSRVRSGRTVMQLSPLLSGKLVHVESVGADRHHILGHNLPSMPRHVRSVSMGSSAWPLQLQLHSSGNMAAAASVAVAAAALPAPVAVSGSTEAVAAVASCRHYITFVGYHLGTASSTACREAVTAMQAKAMLHVVCEASFNMLSPDVSTWAHTEQQAHLVRAAWSNRLMYYPDHTVANHAHMRMQMDPFLAELASRCAAEPTSLSPPTSSSMPVVSSTNGTGGLTHKTAEGGATHSSAVNTQCATDSNNTANQPHTQQQSSVGSAALAGVHVVPLANASQLRRWGSQPLPVDIQPQ